MPSEPLTRRKFAKTCSVEGCDRPRRSNGLCVAHAHRLAKYGDPLPDIPIRVVTGEGSISHGYRKVPVPLEDRHLVNGEPQVLEHRLVMAKYLGRPLFSDEVVHHRNGVRTDNRIENLELWTTAHPKGQGVDDKVRFAMEMLRRYRPDVLMDDT